MIKKVLFNLKADEPNANGTIYPKDVLKEAIKEYNENHVKDGRAFGEINFPRQAAISMVDIAFRINDIEEENDRWLAEIEILNTPKGEELKNIVKKLKNYRIVTYGHGTVEDNVIKDFKIASVGIVPKRELKVKDK
jgi:hypothetical protein